MSDSAPNAFWISINIQPSFLKIEQQLAGSWPVAERHSSAEPSGRQGGPKSAEIAEQG
jgi:hypothetical protein